jgi:hypothetical protein
MTKANQKIVRVHNKKGKFWFVELDNNPNKIIKMLEKKAQTIVNTHTEYIIESYSAIYKWGTHGIPMRNVKYKGFAGNYKIPASSFISINLKVPNEIK